MHVASMHFKERAHESLDDAQLQRNLQKFHGKFVAKRREAMIELDDFEGTRDAARAIRQRALDNLDTWLEIFEANATARGATVLWAETPADVNRLRARHRQRATACAKIIKSKSMVSEESALDRAIEAAGLKVVETDLGEYILQINDYEPPSHIIGPALHKSKEEVADLFAKTHGTPRKLEIDELCLEARQVLRTHYLTADMGISGRQFLRRRDRVGGAGHQRGQRDADHDAAQGARRDFRHREDRSDARGRGDAAAAAAALGDGAVDLELRRHPDRHQGRTANSTARSTCTSSSSTPGDRACSRAMSARRCAASAAARA